MIDLLKNLVVVFASIFTITFVVGSGAYLAFKLITILFGGL